MTAALYAPGSLVKARNREWIVLPGSTAEILKLRPLSGSEEDAALLHTGIEPDITPATFPPPPLEPQAGQEAMQLLRDALLLSLRRGAGPFRSFGNLAFEPRAYQLVPLLMALRQDPVRLLIADDVGIGKTIEAGLIARELYDRGEVGAFAVLCPPHLVEQWVQELDARFHVKATAVTASSAARLERGLPVNESIFSLHPFTVVSLDYIKSERRRHDFVRACPELVIVDEAHTCSNTGAGRHLRYELLKALVQDPERHMVMLTATPHSGDEEAFYRLLGLLDPVFEKLAEPDSPDRTVLRERLANHFVQRRRPDIDEWMDTRIFPQRVTAELTYRLTGPWESFFEKVLAYCAEVTHAAAGDERKQRLTFWGTLALMRCVSSSPAAAARALRTRMGLDGQDPVELAERVFDGEADDLPEDDVEPGADTGDPRLAQLVQEAQRLAGEKGDPKLALLLGHVEQLVKDGFSPVVFCRFVATAHYVKEQLAQRLKDARVEVVTGELATEERVRRVEEVGDPENGRRVLVATDCLSEGVNLQAYFDAVVHYDLSWNPTRHEQREGRVDRYGQPRPVVRASLVYGQNNPVDGAVLNVILRKAQRIARELGVPVPVPDEGHTVTEALMRAVMLRRGQFSRQQELFDFEQLDEAKELETRWVNLAEKAKQNRTVFAQRRLKPEEVLPEWRRLQVALGSQQDVQRFVAASMNRLGAGLEPLKRGARAPLGALPDTLKERLAADALEGTVRVAFEQPAPAGAKFVHRSHPLVASLADDLLERALDDGEARAGFAKLARAAVWRTPAVEKQTTVLLLRLRHQLTWVRAGRSRVLLVEEALPAALLGRSGDTLEAGPHVLEWLDAPAAGDLPDHVRKRVLEEALARLGTLGAQLSDVASRQADALLADHRRVRAASEARGRYDVRALVPVDVIALCVLLPVGA